jgi:hypothetical protein
MWLPKANLADHKAGGHQTSEGFLGQARARSTYLLGQDRRASLRGHRPGGLGEHLQDFCALYKPQYWYFDSLEFVKQLLVVGVVPAAIWATKKNTENSKAPPAPAPPAAGK